jgi:hypothetical protein
MRSRGSEVFAVFQDLLARPEDFVSRPTEEVFGATLAHAQGDERVWADYIVERYTFMARA